MREQLETITEPRAGDGQSTDSILAEFARLIYTVAQELDSPSQPAPSDTFTLANSK